MGSLPLSNCKTFLDPKSAATNVRIVGAHTFVPLATSWNRTIVQLSITMLRPGSPGQVVHSGGDIDNRLKTLLDGLRMPATVAEIPADAKVTTLNEPLYCLLEDDALIGALSVTTDRLLDRPAKQSEVLALIHVVTR